MRHDRDAGGHAHDVALDLVVTPRRTVVTEVSRRRAPAINWHVTIEEKIRAGPLLQRLREERDARG